MSKQDHKYRHGERVQILESAQKFIPEMAIDEVGTIVHAYQANGEIQVVIRLDGTSSEQASPRVSVPDVWAKEAVL